jgi:hypothetical protein
LYRDLLYRDVPAPTSAEKNRRRTRRAGWPTYECVGRPLTARVQRYGSGVTVEDKIGAVSVDARWVADKLSE